MALVNLTVIAASDKMPLYSGTSGRLSAMVNATVDDGRVIFSGLTTKNFEITLWNPQGQALTVANNLKNLFVVETKEVPGVYALSLDWEAQDSRTQYGSINLHWLGPVAGTYLAALRVHEDGAAFLGQTIFSFQAEYREPLEE